MQVTPEVMRLPTIEETPLAMAISNMKETTASDLLINNEEEDEVRIAPLMSSFFFDDDEGDHAPVEATAAIDTPTMETA